MLIIQFGSRALDLLQDVGYFGRPDEGLGRLIVIGSKVPLRSRGVSISISSKSPFNFFEVAPLREFPHLYPTGSCFP